MHEEAKVEVSVQKNVVSIKSTYDRAREATIRKAIIQRKQELKLIKDADSSFKLMFDMLGSF